jgi:hypothetical protein
MKFTREFPTEDKARAYEEVLLALGYKAWRTRKADDSWAVFWCS